MFHIYCNCEIKKCVACSHNCHSANESENHHTFTRKKSISDISLTPRRKNPPEESMKKEHSWIAVKC